MPPETKKKVLIIGFVVLLIVVGLVIFFKKNTPQNNQIATSKYTKLLTDTAQLPPRNSLQQDTSDLINKLPIVTIFSDTAIVAPGQPAIISWSSPNAISCVDGDGNKMRARGSLSITPKEAYKLDISCTNIKGTTSESVIVDVTTSPIISLSAHPMAVATGEQSFISWETVNTTKCTDVDGKTLRLSDGLIVILKKPYTFTINCTGPKGTGKKSVTIAIASPETPTRAVTTPVSSVTTSTMPKAVTTTPKTTTVTGNSNVRMSAMPPFVEYNAPSTISWNTQNVTNCIGVSPTGLIMLDKNTGEELLLLNPGNSIPLADNGAVSIKVLERQTVATLIVRCDKPDGTQTEWSTTVRSKPNECALFGRPKISWFPNKPVAVESGSPALIEWNVRCGTTCTAVVNPTGELITYVDTSKILDYVDDGQGGQTYWIFTPTNGVQSPLAVSPRGGVRVYPTPPGSTVTLKCVNDDDELGRSNTESRTVPTIVHPSCSGWLSCHIDAVIDVITVMSPLSPTLFYDPFGVHDAIKDVTPTSEK